MGRKFPVDLAHKILRTLAHRKGKGIGLLEHNDDGSEGPLLVAYSFDHGRGSKVHRATFTKSRVKVCELGMAQAPVNDPTLIEVFHEFMKTGEGSTYHLSKKDRLIAEVTAQLKVYEGPGHGNPYDPEDTGFIKAEGQAQAYRDVLDIIERIYGESKS